MQEDTPHQQQPPQLPPTEYYAAEWKRYEALRNRLAQLLVGDGTDAQLEISTLCSQVCQSLATLDGWTPKHPETYEQRRTRSSLRVILEDMQNTQRHQSKLFF